MPAEAYDFLEGLTQLQSIRITGSASPSLEILETLQELTYMSIPRLQTRERAKLKKSLPYSAWFTDVE